MQSYNAEEFTRWLLSNEENFIGFLCDNNPEGVADALNELEVDFGVVTPEELKHKAIQWFKQHRDKNIFKRLMQIEIPQQVIVKQ